MIEAPFLRADCTGLLAIPTGGEETILTFDVRKGEEGHAQLRGDLGREPEAEGLALGNRPDEGQHQGHLVRGRLVVGEGQPRRLRMHVLRERQMRYPQKRVDPGHVQLISSNLRGEQR